MLNPKILSEDLLIISEAGYGNLIRQQQLIAARPATDPWTGQSVAVPEMEIEDGIAYIPVNGPIGRGLNKFDRAFGSVDVADIETDLIEADADESVRAAILLIDSPGGMYSGTPELGDFISEFDKPVYSFVNGCCASGALWLAAATDGIFATRSSAIGSVGVYSVFSDYSKLAEMAGIKVRVFSSGNYKGMGIPGTSLTESQEKLIQDRILEMADTFYEHMRANRKDVADADMQGQVFQGDQAQRRGFIDGLMRTADELVEFIG